MGAPRVKFCPERGCATRLPLANLDLGLIEEKNEVELRASNVTIVKAAGH